MVILSPRFCRLSSDYLARFCHSSSQCKPVLAIKAKLFNF
jgi:hypothetical protein